MINLPDLYYTPEIIAYYCYENDLTIKQAYSLIDSIYNIEYKFINIKYKLDIKSFRYQLMDYWDYLIDKEEYLNDISTIKNYYEELHIPLNVIEETSSLDYFFIKIRLDMIFFNAPYRRIKFRTLLKKYGYKRRSDKFKSHIHKCMDFYQLKGFSNKKEINLNTINIEDMITFKKVNRLK